MWWKSKTIWTNIVGAACIFVEVILGVPIEVPELTAGVLAVVNIVLRFKTGEPLGV